MNITRKEGREDCEDGWEANLKPLVCKTGMVGAALRSETQRERQGCPSIFMTDISRWMVLSFWGGSWETRCRILSLGVGRLRLRCPKLAWEESIPAGS